jgi:hypothetical protein
MVFVGSLHLGKNKAMKQRFLFALFVFWALAATAAGDPAVIASPQWVHEHRNDPGLVILQVNFLKLDYEREHIATTRKPEVSTSRSPVGRQKCCAALEFPETLQSCCAMCATKSQ